MVHVRFNLSARCQWVVGVKVLPEVRDLLMRVSFRTRHSFNSTNISWSIEIEVLEFRMVSITLWNRMMSS